MIKLDIVLFVCVSLQNFERNPYRVLTAVLWAVAGHLGDNIILANLSVCAYPHLPNILVVPIIALYHNI